jgi:hypothetical protein
MLVKIESAPFNGGKLRYNTSNQLFIIERKSVNSKSPMGTRDNGEHTAVEDLGISVVSKGKPLKGPDQANIVLSESEVWTKKIENIYPYSPFLRTAHEGVL